jgi:hypothetical protein
MQAVLDIRTLYILTPKLRFICQIQADKHFKLSRSGAVCQPSQHFSLGNITNLRCAYNSISLFVHFTLIIL